MTSRTLKANDPKAKPLEELRLANQTQTEAARAKRRPGAKKAAQPAPPAAAGESETG